MEVLAQDRRSRRPGVGLPAGRYRRALQVVSGITLAAVLGLSFLSERAQPVAVLLALLAACTFIWSAGWLSAKRGLALALLFDVVLLFAYLWSLDEQTSVTVWSTPRGFAGRIGDNVAVLTAHPKPGDVGLYSGDIRRYLVPPGAGKFDPASPLAGLTSWLRFSAPRSAWSHVTVTGPSGAPIQSPFMHLTRGWSQNRRGELEGDLGAPPLLMHSPRAGFRFSADLMRGDGTQGALVQVSRNRGYILLIRGDQNWAYWAPWKGHPGPSIRWAGAGGHSPHYSLRLLPMIQKTLLFSLPSVVLALVLLVLVMTAYLLVQPLAVVGSYLQAHLAPLNRASSAALHSPDRSAPLLESRVWRRLADVLALGVATWGLLAAAYVARALLHGVPNVEDSIAYVFQAKIFALGRLWAPTPKLPSFFREEFLLMYHDHWFGKYTPGWPLLLSAGVKLGADWLVNPVLLGLCLLLTYLIGKEIYGRPVALLAAVIAAGSPFLLFFAGTLMAHTATLACLLGAAYLVVLWDRREQKQVGGVKLRLSGWRFLLPAGFLLGFAATTRQLDTIGFALPFAFLFVRRPLAIGWVAVAADVPVALGLAFNKDLTGGFLTSPYAVQYPWDRLGFGPTVGGPGTWNVNYTLAKGFWNLAYNIELLQVNLFGWPYYFAFAFAAIPFVLGRAKRWDLLLAASTVTLFVVYLAYYSPGDWFGFPRYTYVAIPWLALLTARGFQELYYLALRLPIRGPASRAAALVAPLLLTFGLIAYTCVVYMPTERTVIAGYDQGTNLAVQTVRQAHLHHALVFQTQNPTYWWPYGGVVTENSPLLNGDVVYARDLGPADRKLMRLYPGRRYYRLNWTALIPMRP